MNGSGLRGSGIRQFFCLLFATAFVVYWVGHALFGTEDRDVFGHMEAPCGIVRFDAVADGAEISADGEHLAHATVSPWRAMNHQLDYDWVPQAGETCVTTMSARVEVHPRLTVQIGGLSGEFTMDGQYAVLTRD